MKSNKNGTFIDFVKKVLTKLRKDSDDFSPRIEKVNKITEEVWKLPEFPRSNELE